MKKKILLVEDNLLLRKGLNRSFEGFWSKKPITQNNTAY